MVSPWSGRAGDRAAEVVMRAISLEFHVTPVVQQKRRTTFLLYEVKRSESRTVSGPWWSWAVECD